MRDITEHYSRIADADCRWDVALWQQAGPEAIFHAAWGLICDYELMRGRDATKLRLQRTVEHYGPVHS
jgi:hypothetical protein